MASQRTHSIHRERCPAPLTFTYSIPDYFLTVSSGFPTTSGSNFLGLNNDTLTFGDKAFNLGDSFTINFGRKVNAVGLYVVAGDDAMPGDLELSTSGGAVFNSNSPLVISPGNNAYFLGLLESDPTLGFTSATVRGVVPQDAPGPISLSLPTTSRARSPQYRSLAPGR